VTRSIEALYCDVPGCDKPAPGHGKGKCWRHLKQLQRHGRIIDAPPLSLRQKAIEACIAMVDASTVDEGDYEAKKKSFDEALDELVDQRVTQRRRALARAAAVRLGKPPRVSDAQLLETYARAGGVVATARRLRLAKSTVSERLKKIRSTFTEHHAESSAPRAKASR